MKLDALKARLREQAVEIDEDWASDIQEGGNAPKPVNIPAEALTAITDLEALVGELGEALRELEQTEADYRHMHDLHGGGSIKTGRRWDWMRRAGDKARATLAKLEKARG